MGLLSGIMEPSIDDMRLRDGLRVDLVPLMAWMLEDSWVME